MHQLGVEYIDDLIGDELTGSTESELLLRFIQIDSCFAIIEVIALCELFSGMIECIVDFLHVNNRHHIKTTFLSHRIILFASISTSLITG